ncbi:hypothetical protein [Sporolactobacillus vineae]|uniref:hypothetical protein n=1 Tax=Sporolactobacillus vineae TaxID=444463 RepID=UPI00028A36F7|nr:hypothetical protein [Sporolactobacillus vineae]
MKIGEWVHTKYLGKHHCIGFITALYPGFQRCKLRVTQCDRYPGMKWLEISYDDVIGEKGYRFSPGEIDSMIDLALATRDRNWFENLMVLRSVRGRS